MTYKPLRSLRSPGTAFAVALALTVGSSTVLAEHEPSELNEQVPVVLSASRLIQPLGDSPASITLIDREMIEQSGARSIADVLLLVSGFQVGRLANGNPTVTYQGLSERYNPRIQLIIDGRSAYVPLYGGVPWSELPLALNTIERIEVTRAPNAATYGPNSYKAVVSITTRLPASSSGWELDAQGGGNEFASSTLSYFGSADQLDYRFTVQAEKDEGYDNLPDTERSQLASLSSTVQLDSDDRIGVELGGLRGGHTEVSTALDPRLFSSYEETDNAYFQTYWERSRSSDDSLRLQYYYTFYDVDDDEFFSLDLGELFNEPLLDGVLGELDLDRSSRSTRQELEVQRVKRVGRGHRLVFGAALRRDTVQGQILFGDPSRRAIDTQRVFAHSEYQPTPRLTLNSGMLVENNSLSGVSASPRAALIFASAPGQRWRLGYSRGVRSPLLLEEEGNVAVQYTLEDGTVLDDVTIFDRERIEAETSDVLDVGYVWMVPSTGLTLDAKISRHRLNGLIANRRQRNFEGDTFDQSARYFENRFNVTYSNAELEIDIEPRPDLRLRASYSYAFGQDSALEIRQLIPRHTLSLFGSYRLGRDTTLSSEYYYTSDWIWDDVRDISNRDRLDVRLARSVRFGKLDASFSIQAELELSDNVDYLERNEVDDHFFAGVSLQLP